MSPRNIYWYRRYCCFRILFYGVYEFFNKKRLKKDNNFRLYFALPGQAAQVGVTADEPLQKDFF
jgi:hypothetical protein